MDERFDGIIQRITSSRWIPFLIAVSLILVAFVDVLSMKNVFIGGYQDILHHLLPRFIYRDGGFPLWNNLWITGFPEFASPLSDIYYPLTLPLVYIVDDIFIQINYAILLHLFVAFLTAYLLLGLLTEKKSVRIVFSLFYIFSALTLSRIYAGHEMTVFAIAWTPLLFYSFAKIVYKAEYTVKNIAIFTLSSTLIFFTGALYYIAFSYLFMAIFLFYFIISQKTDVKAVVVLAVSTILFLLITAVKSIPVLSISDQITRVDGAVDPFAGGGSLESNLASFIFGTPINKGYSYTGLQYGIHESTVLIGAISVFLIIIALVYGKRIITVPSFLSIVFALIWADGGKNLFSFIHLFPVLSSFRCPGRIFCTLLPVLIFLSVYGFILLNKKLEESESFKLKNTQKKYLVYGTLILISIKITELPFLEAVSPEAFVSLLLVFGFIALVYYEKITRDSLIYIFSVALLVNIAFIIVDFTLTPLVIGKTIIIALVILGLLFHEIKAHIPDKKSRIIPVLVGLNIVICCMAGLTFIQPSDPGFDTSNAIEIIREMDNLPTGNVQKWAVTTGWAYEDMDYTYHFMNNGIHSVSSYYAYYLNNALPVIYTLGDKQYSTVDYIVDTAYADSGVPAIENYTAMVNGIPVTVPENILPNAFIVRNNEIIPVEIKKFTPDEVIADGKFKEGDLAVLKTAFYEGWTVNGNEAVSVGNMVGSKLKSGADKVVFKFQPSSFTEGAVLSLIGIISLIVLVLFRKKFEKILPAKTGKKK